MAQRQPLRYDDPEPQTRLNEYFIDQDGISREVIQADICRYLGRDALVRPGTHQVGLSLFPFLSSLSRYPFLPRKLIHLGAWTEITDTDKQGRPGYFIRAYRNLTTVGDQHLLYIIIYIILTPYCGIGNDCGSESRFKALGCRGPPQTRRWSA